MAPKILTRLTRQLRSRGIKGAKAMAYALLNKRGHMKGKKLTAKGAKRNSMSPGQRAIDRASKKSGRSKRAYRYVKRTNRAVLKG